MTAIDMVIQGTLSNAGLALAMAVVVAFVARRVHWPAAVHALWLMVLLRMVVPPIVGIPLLTAAPLPDAAGLVSLEAGAVALAGAASGGQVSVAQVAGLLWLIGAIAVATLAVLRSRALRRALEATAPAYPALERRVDDLARRLGTSPPRTLMVAGRVPPMLWGRLSGTVLLLPDELLERLNEPQLDALIAHELAHLRRRDHWLRWLELVVTVACWFNPVTWWARRRLRQAEERCCDALVSQTLPTHARAYADTLVETLRFLAGTRVPRPIGAVGMADLSEVQRRLEMILSHGPARRPSFVARFVLLTVLAGGLILTPVLASGGSDRDLPEVFDQPITLHLEDADLMDVLDSVQTLTGVDVQVDPKVSGTVTVWLKDVPVDEVLDEITFRNGAAWKYRDGAIDVFPIPSPPTAPVRVGLLGKEPVYRVEEGGFVTHPKKISGPNPIYPEDCREQKVTGVVVTEAVIDATGSVVNITIMRSPDDRLSEAAMDAIRQWVFEPAMLDGTPVAVRYVLTVKFALE